MTKEISIIALADKLNGKIIGNYDTKMKLNGTCPVDNYRPGKVTFVKKPKYLNFLSKLEKAVVLVPESWTELWGKYSGNIYIAVRDVPGSIMLLQEFFYKERFEIKSEGISSTAKIEPGVKLGKHVFIGDNVYIGANSVVGDGTKIMTNCYLFDNVTIGKNNSIHPGVYMYRDTVIGDDCLINPGACIGIDGFRYEQDVEHKLLKKMLHVGGVQIGNRVEIDANTAIDRATFEGEKTRIDDDVKIDNLVHVAHNAHIGARTVIVTLSCIGGSCVIGEDVWIGIGVSIANGVTVGNRAKLLMNAVVAYDVAEDEIMSGFYAMPHKRWKQVWKKLKEEL